MKDLVPYPHTDDLRAWALQLVEYLQSKDPNTDELLPAPVLLVHIDSDPQIKPQPNGVLAYRAADKAVLVSKDGIWSPIGGEVVSQQVGWVDVTGKPDKFPPTDHTHNWNKITGKPTQFPPQYHTHEYSDILGEPPGLEDLRADLIKHINDKKNPHKMVFRRLRDVPNSYSGQTGKVVAVNSTEDALEFVDPLANVFIGSTPPSNPVDGTLWMNNDDPIGLFIYYDDGDSEQWVAVAQAGPKGDNAVTFVQETAPSSPVVGDLWYRTGTANPGLYIYYNDGTSSQWVQTNGP